MRKKSSGMFQNSNPVLTSFKSVLTSLKAVLLQVCQNGAWIEDKGTLMTFHYRNVDVDKRDPLIAKAKQIIKDAGYKVRH